MPREIFAKISAALLRRRPPRASRVRKLASDLEILYDPEESQRNDTKGGHSQTVVDIVAVHGLGSKSHQAWVHRATGSNWLRDFLPKDLEGQARIMTFNHDSRWRSHSLRKTLESYGKDFLVSLERVRGTKEFSARPLILVGHSFGGLLIKQALVLAGELHADGRHAGVSSSTSGIMFLGVPHLGSKLAALGKLVAGFTALVGSRTDLLEIVGEESREAASLHDRFLKGYQKQAEVVCFYECIDSYVGKVSIGPVVSEHSASIPGGHNLSLTADHKGMNKFSSPTDENYIRVMHEIKRIVARNSLQKERVNARLSENKNANRFSLIPYARNNTFINRGIVEHLRQKMNGSRGSHGQRIALWGLGGVGKTQLVLEHAYRVAIDSSSECVVFWVHASDRASFAQAYRNIAQLSGLSISAEEKEESLLQKVKDWLESPVGPPFLLVLDNADNLLDFFPSSNTEEDSHNAVTGLVKFIPQGTKGSVIITSRDYQIASRLAGPNHTFHITAMSGEEAEQLFIQQYPDYNSTQDKEILVQLLDELAHLPLAVVHAASYIRENFLTPAQYVALFRSKNAETKILSRGYISDFQRRNEVPAAVLTTYFITFRQVQEQSSLAANLLRFIASLDRHEIPEEILAASGIDGVEDQLLFHEAIGKLLALSLASRSRASSYEIHRLVHLSIQASLSPKETETWRMKTLHAVYKLFPRDEKVLEDIELCAKYIGHALAVTQDTATLETASLLSSMGHYYWYRGRYREAEMQIRRALVLYSDLESGPTLNHVLARSRLTRILISQGKYEEAESIAREDLSTLEKVVGTEHQEYLHCLSNLGSILSKQGKYDDAEHINRRAVKAQSELLGNFHPDTVTTTNNMMFLMAREGRLAESEAMTRRALKERQEAVGADHPTTQAIANDLGWLLLLQKKFREAEGHGRDLLELRQKHLGKEHPDTLTSINFLAWVLMKRQKLAEAEELSRQVLVGREKLLGEDHPDTLSSLNSLSWILLKRWRYAEAEQVNQRALVGRQRVLGEQHPVTLASMYGLAWNLKDQGKVEEAMVLSQKTLDIRRKVLGATHLYTTRSEAQYSNISKAMTRLQKKKLLITKAENNHVRIRKMYSRR